MIEEIWKNIPGYEGMYMVSNFGNVKSFKNGKDILRRLGKMKNGYAYVTLFKNGKVKTFYVHRLVWEAFNGQISEGFEVNHKDEEKTNNSLDNLELLTHKENMNYGTRNQRVAESKSKPIIGRNKLTGEETEYSSSMEAERQIGIAHQSIRSCCQGKLKSAGGYVWRYKD